LLAEEVLKRYKDENLPEFVEHPLVDVNQRGNFGNTPLHVASVRGDLEEIEALLDGGAQVDARGERGFTPLHEATLQRHVVVVKRLLSAGATPSLANDDGNTARDLAAQQKFDDVVVVIDEWEKKKP
jgi:ankyrin repeat protein